MTTPGVVDPDPFELLGVSEFSSDEVINASWKRLIRLAHPDYATSDEDRERRLEKSIALNGAHDTLLDPGLKAEAVLERHRRSGGVPQPEPAHAPASGTDGGTWAGARWSGYRPGGHPEARDAWAYTEPAGASPAGARPPAPPSLLRRGPAPVRIIGITLVIFAEIAWWFLKAVDRMFSRGRGPLDPDDY